MFDAKFISAVNLVGIALMILIPNMKLKKTAEITVFGVVLIAMCLINFTVLF